MQNRTPRSEASWLFIPPEGSTEKLLTKRQLAALLQVSTRTIDRWLSERRLPDNLRVEISGTVRFRSNVAEHWLSAGCPRGCTDKRDIREVDA